MRVAGHDAAGDVSPAAIAAGVAGLAVITYSGLGMLFWPDAGGVSATAGGVGVGLAAGGAAWRMVATRIGARPRVRR